MKNYKSIFVAFAALFIISCSSEFTENGDNLNTDPSTKTKTPISPPCFITDFASPTTVFYDCTPTLGDTYANSITLNFGEIAPSPITMLVEIQEYVQDCDSNAPDEPSISYLGTLHTFEYSTEDFNLGSLIIGNLNAAAYGVTLDPVPDLTTLRCFAWRIGYETFSEGELCTQFKSWHFETFKANC